MKIILTVTGIDHEGIIAAVTATLAERKVNVLDVSQTIMGEFFTMIMHCSFDEDEQNLSTCRKPWLVSSTNRGSRFASGRIHLQGNAHHLGSHHDE